MTSRLSAANANLAARLGTAVVMVPVLIWLVFFAPPIWFYGLIFIATGVGALEFFRMTHPGDAVAQGIGILCTLGVSVLLYFGQGEPRLLLAMLLGLPLVALLVPLWRLGDIQTAALRVMAGAFGPLYVGALTALPLLLRERGKEGPGFVLLALAVAWWGDTLGYFAGRFLGRHKLYEAVSPKKTVEGAFGSLLGSLLAVFFARAVALPNLPLSHGLPLAVVASVLGQLGDLGESLLKRSTGVKDSGGIVPGHGGILDRVDALIVASVLLYLYTRVREPWTLGG